MSIPLEKLLIETQRQISQGIRVSELTAPPGFAPQDWQTSTQPTYGGNGQQVKPPVSSSEDLRRIIALPRRPRPDNARAAALIQFVTARFRFDRTTPCECRRLRPQDPEPCLTRLLLAQAWGLHEITTTGGLLGPIGVGHGKTILNILAPLAMPDCRRAVLLVPPNLLDQLIDEYELLAQHFHVPSLVVHGRDHVVAREGVPVLHVLPYSRLSRPESTAFLEHLQPDLIVADEADKLRHPATATTARVLRYFGRHGECRFCGWSGSITDSSIKDYAHLSALALRYKSPLPLDPIVVEDWARALDPSDWQAPPGALLQLCSPGEHVYDGFNRRLTETEGVVSTEEPAVDVELRIEERQAPPIPAHLDAMMAGVRGTWVRPDGEEMVDAITVARCLRELACGFYYRWIFPRGEQRHVIDEWRDARKEWHRELRRKLMSREEHLDSEHLCTLAAMRAWGHVENVDDRPAWRAVCWPRWREVKATVQPETEPVRVDDYLARDATAWARGNTGIVWYEHVAFGQWVAEVSGLPMFAGGTKNAKAILTERGQRSIIASINSHGRGRNGLQFSFNRQLVANPPTSSTKWEQLLGRLHRTKQRAEYVTAEFYRHTEELAAHVDQAVGRALYVQGTLGTKQKLLVGFPGGIDRLRAT